MNSAKPLVSPNEIVQLSSGENIELDPTRITLHIILVAQRRYIKPALGTKLYNAITEGKYTEFTRKFIKPALALFVARSIIYNHAVRIGVGGVAIPIPENHVKPSKEDLFQIMNTLKKEAEIVVKMAVEHITNSNEFHEFNIIESTSTTSTIGGMIIT